MYRQPEKLQYITRNAISAKFPPETPEKTLVC